MSELTENAKDILDTFFDDLEDIKNNYFPERTKADIIAVLNIIGENEDGDMVTWMNVCFEAVDYGRRSLLKGSYNE